MIKDERNMMVMNEKKKVFEEYHALKALMIMAVPAIISQLITLIYNMMWVSKVSFLMTFDTDIATFDL